MKLHVADATYMVTISYCY